MSATKIHIYQYVSNPVCAPYRLTFPATVLNGDDRFRVTAFTEFDRDTFRSIKHDGNILVVQRLQMSSNLASIFAELKRFGILIIYDLDDNLLHLNPESRFAQQAPKDYSERIRACALASHAVQCSTRALAREVAKFHPESKVLENQLDVVPPFVENRPSERPIIVGYAAGEDHYPDWLTIKDGFNQTIRELEAQGKSIESWIIGDRDIFDSVESTSKKFYPLLTREAYLRVLQHIDISIIPLADNCFNVCKSDVKFLESAASGCAVIASSVAYSKSIQHGQTGYLFDNEKEFALLLAQLVTSYKSVLSAAQKAHDYVSRYRLIEQHRSMWIQTYLDWSARYYSAIGC